MKSIEINHVNYRTNTIWIGDVIYNLNDVVDILSIKNIDIYRALKKYNVDIHKVNESYFLLCCIVKNEDIVNLLINENHPILEEDVNSIMYSMIDNNWCITMHNMIHHCTNVINNNNKKGIPSSSLICACCYAIKSKKTEFIKLLCPLNDFDRIPDLINSFLILSIKSSAADIIEYFIEGGVHTGVDERILEEATQTGDAHIIELVRSGMR